MKRLCIATLVLSAVAGMASAQTTRGAAIRADWANRSAGLTSSTASSDRIETPEAIFVCTLPDGRGNFVCSTPVSNRISGGPNSLAEWRTPEVMLHSMSAACPSPHRLASTTHLVWGCGFGATNNSNSMDRSAGVDVEGRYTYYCSEKQTSCRRTQP